MNSIKKIWLIVQKDLISELRSKEIFSSMFFFVVVVIIVFNFSFEIGEEKLADILGGILWVAFLFAGVLGLNRSFLLEKEKDCLQGLMLCPVERGLIYFGKFIGNLIFLLVVILFSLPLFSVFFNLNILRIFPLLSLVIFLGIIGFISVGTILSAMSVNTRMREVLLPILLFPIVIPVLIASVKATSKIFLGFGMKEISGWLKLLFAFDIIYIVVCYLTFEYVIEE
jgi:heme exporter protein B